MEKGGGTEGIPEPGIPATAMRRRLDSGRWLYLSVVRKLVSSEV